LVRVAREASMASPTRLASPPFWLLNTSKAVTCARASASSAARRRLSCRGCRATATGRERGVLAGGLMWGWAGTCNAAQIGAR